LCDKNSLTDYSLFSKVLMPSMLLSLHLRYKLPNFYDKTSIVFNAIIGSFSGV
jgi:hypothetical protein